MFEKFKALKAFLHLDAASSLPPIAPIKVKPGARSIPAFVTTATPANGQLISKPERRLVNTDTTTFRNGNSTAKVLQDMAVASPELASALWTAVRLGVPERFVAVARNLDSTLNPEATRALQEILARFNVLGDPKEGYTGAGSIKSVSESLARDIMLYGQMTCELVLDRSRLPYRLQPISSSVVQFRVDGYGVTPVQIVAGVDHSLDNPCVCIVQLDQDNLTPFANSPLETALKPALFSEMLQNQLARVLDRVLAPRMKVSIDHDMVMKQLSPEAQQDASKAAAEISAITESIGQYINGLAPEQALVHLSSIGFTVDPAPTSDNYAVLRDIANGKMASGAKSLSSVLGLEAGGSSSNIASTEVAIYLVSVSSAVKHKLDEVYSRLLSVAIRLLGFDCFVEFRYEEVSIRPKAEMIAFAQTQQGMTLDLWSLGLYTDDEASLMLTGKLPPATGFKSLSGTMFRQQTAAAPIQNPSNSGSSLNQDLNPTTPDTARGKNTNKNKKAEDEALEQVAQQPTFVTPNITVAIDNTQTKASIIKMRRDEDNNLILERTEDAA